MNTFGVETLKALVVAYLFGYSSFALESFGDNFYLSKLSENINKINKSILSNHTTISLRKTIDLNKLVNSKGVVVDYRNPIQDFLKGGSVESSFIVHKNTAGTILYDVKVLDDGYGKLNVISVDSTTGVSTIVYPSVGTVNYKTGVITFDGKFSPIIVTSKQQYLTLTVKPLNDDVFVFENKILRISNVHADSVSVKLISHQKRKETLTA